MTVKAKFSNTMRAKQNRFKKIPKIYEDYLLAVNKGDAVDFIEQFQKGIKLNDLGLRRLEKRTTEYKRAMGQSQPDTPLYGYGEQEKNSLINAHGIRKLKNGWKVYLRNAKHHGKRGKYVTQSTISLKKLVLIHENGAYIKSKNGHTVRIPPRPARRKAYNKVLTRRLRNKRERSLQMKKAISYYMKGNEFYIQRIIRNFMNKGKKFESLD